MDPVTMALMMGGSSLMQNMQQRAQQSRNAISDSEMMRNSPWTGLASQAAQQNSQNRQFHGGQDLTQGLTSSLAHGIAQSEANKKANEESSFKDRWMKLLEKQNNPQIAALENFQPKNTSDLSSLMAQSNGL